MNSIVNLMNYTKFESIQVICSQKNKNIKAKYGILNKQYNLEIKKFLKMDQKLFLT